MARRTRTVADTARVGAAALLSTNTRARGCPSVSSSVVRAALGRACCWRAATAGAHSQQECSAQAGVSQVDLPRLVRQRLDHPRTALEGAAPMSLVLQVTLVVIVVAGVIAFVVYGGRMLVSLTRPDDPTHAPGAQVLRYHFDVGLEPASVLDEVRHAGYHATTEFRHGRVDLLVAWSGDPAVEREKVRAAIAGAPDRQGLHGGMPPPVVRFADEPPWTQR